MGERHRRSRRTPDIWDEANTTEENQENSYIDEPMNDEYTADQSDYEDAFYSDIPSEDSTLATNEEQDQKKGLFPLSKENLILACIGFAALAIAIVFGVLLATQSNANDQTTTATETSVPYDIYQPFSASDLTQTQLDTLKSGESIILSENQVGPHGIKLGDTIDTLLQCFPVSFTQVSDTFEWDSEADDMTGTSDMLENDYQIIYAKSVLYQDGQAIILPPSGTLTVLSDMIVMTLIAPLTEYPDSIGADYVHYPHIYCKITIDPETSKAKRIELVQSN